MLAGHVPPAPRQYHATTGYSIMIKHISSVALAATLSFAASTELALAVDNKPNMDGAGKAPFAFALIGDAPYGVPAGEYYQPFVDLTNEVNADDRIKWVLHAGDIKSGGSACSDAMFQDRLERYNKFNRPVILTPGDNEWTDCHRVAAGEYQPLERLAKLREVFYPVPGMVTIGGKSMQVTTQATDPQYAEFPENVMWKQSGVVFSAIHVVGSSNGLEVFDPASSAVRTQADDDEVARRTKAALNWLDATFAEAGQDDAPGVFIMIHANPGLEKSGANRYGFEAFLDALEAHAISYGKPVILAHGDSHYFRVDQPVINSYVNNLMRLETFGSNKVNWVKVVVDPKADEVFNIQPMIVNN